MALTLEEARTLDTFAKLGTIAKTASALRKSGSAVVYALDSIEKKSGLKVLDRSHYRTTILPDGLRVLEGCRKMLQAEFELSQLCSSISHGWEPELKVIVDGVVPIHPVLKAINIISKQKIPTRFHLVAEFLGSVEQTFIDQQADLMISVLPPQKLSLESIRLPEVPAILVAASNHPLVKTKKKITQSELQNYPLLTVRGSDPRLALATSTIESSSSIQLTDFHSKKLALTMGLGYGWIPSSMVESELKSGKLKPVTWTRSNLHVFKPYLYYRNENTLGNTGRLLVKHLS